MVFAENNKAIYLQIVDKIGDDVLAGNYPEECRLPSVREYASAVEVNANTVMRAYDVLASQGVIYNRRGVGYFTAPGAREKVLQQRREYFFNNEIGRFFRQLQLLDVSADNLVEMYNEYCFKNQIK